MSPGSDPSEAGVADVRAAATRLLARREYARVELERRLTGRGFPADVVAATLDELAAANLQSDERFAESFVRARAERGHGPLRIRRELGERGVPASLADRALAEGGGYGAALVRRVRTKRLGAAPPKDYPGRARQMRFLHYRGFAEDQIRAALGED